MRLILFISLVIFGFTLLVASPQQKADEDKEFRLYKQQFNKTYNGTDSSGNKKSESKARECYLKNAAKVKQHNADTKATYKQALNAQSDKTEEDMDKRRGLKADDPESNSGFKKNLKAFKGIKNAKKLKSSGVGNDIDPSKFSLKATGMKITEDRNLKGANAASMDLRSNLSPIKNQKGCGSCWAFAAIALLEYESRINKTGLFFSEQSLVDCDQLNKGCEGGNYLAALVWARFMGVAQEKVYGYTGQKGTCKTVDKSMNYSHPYNFCYMGGVTEQTLLNAMNKYRRPFAVGVHTKGTGFDLYKSGVFFDSKCSSDPKLIDHAVVVVGYGRDNTLKMDFWIIRNSWGTTWGEKGYMRLARNRNNHCGITNLVVYACQD